MKEFKFSDLKWDGDGELRWLKKGDLEFPGFYDFFSDMDLYYHISIYQHIRVDKSPYEVKLLCDWEDYPDNLEFKREVDTEEEVEEVVNEYFAFVKSKFAWYVVGDNTYKSRERAEEVSNGKEIKVVYDYPTDEHREFFEGNGEFTNAYD